MMKKLPVAAVSLALLILSGPIHASAEEPLGIGLEGFAYPYPVHMFVIPEGGERLNMAYMDVPPEGDLNGRTALLLHGRNFPSSYWQATIKALAADGYRVVVPDQIGFGKSSKPLADLHFDELARNTASLLEFSQHRDRRCRRALHGRHARHPLCPQLPCPRRAHGACRTDRA